MDFDDWEDMYLTPEDHRALDYAESCPASRSGQLSLPQDGQIDHRSHGVDSESDTHWHANLNNPRATASESPTSELPLPVVSRNGKHRQPKGSTDHDHQVTDPRPKPRLGRPPGTGYKQKQQANLALSGEPPDSSKKRRPGRPWKNTPLKVSIKFGPLEPGVQQPTGICSTNLTYESPTYSPNGPNPSPTASLSTSIESRLGVWEAPRAWHLDVESAVGGPVNLNQRQATEPTPTFTTECPLSTNQIIPDEDLQRAAEFGDEDNFDAVGNGLGEEDKYRNDEDEIDEEDESRER